MMMMMTDDDDGSQIEDFNDEDTVRSPDSQNLDRDSP